LAGVNPEPDGMEVVLTAARRTRELQNKKQLVNLDVLTPGFSLIFLLTYLLGLILGYAIILRPSFS